MCSLILVLFVVCVSFVGPIRSEEQAAAASLPPLFDYDNYERVFRKHYEPLEETARRAYFIPRALHVFTSAVSYRFRRSDYHLALNHMSDYLPVEIEMMYNHARNSSGKLNEAKRLKKEPSQTRLGANVRVEDISNEELKAKLEQLKAETPMATDLLEAAQKRVKRSAAAEADKTPALGVRELHLADLISTGDQEDAKLSEGQLKVKTRVRSNNKNYQPLELDSQGIEPRNFRRTNFFSMDMEYLSFDDVLQEEKARLWNMIDINRGLDNIPEATIDSSTKALYLVDHSRGACMDRPRNQGRCGACYAFASVAIFEWLYCKKFGELVQFSEQYMIDCGQEYIDSIDGCSGGTYSSGPDFVRNFGLELRSYYPYKAKDQTCPLDRASTDLEKTGFIRFDLSSGYAIPYQLWAEFLHFSPLVVSMSTENTDFLAYKRGIHDPTGCDLLSSTSHAMVLVGYGVEDGKEFWKLRNSHGSNWGERGYYRLLKDEFGECFKDPAFAFATSDGFTFEMDEMLRVDDRIIVRPNEKRKKSLWSWAG